MRKTVQGVLALGLLLGAQILTGRLEGAIFSPNGRPLAGQAVMISGATGFVITVHIDGDGRFATRVTRSREHVVGAGSR